MNSFALNGPNVFPLLREKDLADGCGEVYLPDALARKYPAAAREWAWQWLFPSARISIDPRSCERRRHHADPQALQRAVRAAVRLAQIPKPVHVADDPLQTAALHVQRTADADAWLAHDVGIDHGGVEFLVAEQLLHGCGYRTPLRADG